MFLGHFFKEVAVVSAVVAIPMQKEYDALRILLGLPAIAIKNQSLVVHALYHVLELVPNWREGLPHELSLYSYVIRH